MGSKVEFILGFLYPRCCPVCGKIVMPKGNKICAGCKEHLIYIKEPRCKKCSKPIMNEEQEYCFDCSGKNFSYICGRALFEYNKEMKQSISEFKFHAKKEYVDFYVEEMLQHYKTWISDIEPDVILPVPLHKSKRRQRGFNQAELLAKGLGKVLKIPVITDFLIREKNTVPQKLLDNKERAKNLKHAFKVSDKYSKGNQMLYASKALLVDDIYTTGTTIDLCSKVLKENGISQVYFMTVCIGKGY